jgi:pimeloyl-ACP methyl ester carboxylesterase
MPWNHPISRRLLLDLVLCVIVLMAAYAVRGWILATWLHGAYPFSSLLVDVLGLGLLILLFRAVDGGVAVGLGRLLGKEKRHRRLFAGVLRFGLVFVIAAPFLVTLSQLHPQRIVPGIDARQVGVPCEAIWLEAGGQRLSAWHLPQERSSKSPVLILHGVGSNKQNFLTVGQMLVEAGHPVLLLDFRAHGNSEGMLTTLGYREIEDVKAAHDWLVQRYPDRPVHVLGYSMGAAAAVRAAGTYGIFDRLVLDSCFARVENSIRHGAAQWFLPPPLPAAWWYTMRGWARVFTGIDLDRLCPEEEIARLAGRRILLIHGTADATTPFGDSVRLQECTQGRALLWLVEGAGHLQAIVHPEYASRLHDFLSQDDGRSE